MSTGTRSRTGTEPRLPGRDGHRDRLTLEAALASVDALGDLMTEEAVRADRTATVPAASIDALREAGLWSAAVPVEYGGHGLDAVALTALAARLASRCAATAMIWSMHQLQVACLARAAPDRPILAGYLAEAAREQHLIASVTSEAGIGGRMRTSSAAAVHDGDLVTFEKQATTISYGEVADSFLVTLRRNAEASASDQVLVLARRTEVELERTGTWNTLGMRGTASPPFRVRATVPAAHVLAEPFSSIATLCMVPLSHLLWAAVWTGIAADAVRRAVRYTRVKARKAVGSGGSPADARLGEAYGQLRLIQGAVHQFAAEYAGWDGAAEQAGPITVRANALKTAVSTEASRTVERALEVCGIAGYSEDGPYSVARHVRDLYSARLMVSNNQINQANSELLLLGDGLGTL